MPTIRFGSKADRSRLAPYAERVLRDIATACGVSSLLVTSLYRTPSEQARIMFENCEGRGAAHQHRLYGPNGDLIVDVYEDCKARGLSREATIEAMAARIIDIGPGKVSHHCADPSRLNVVDVAPSSIGSKAKAFEAAVAADKRVSKFLLPPADPAYHMEIPLPS